MNYVAPKVMAVGVYGHFPDDPAPGVADKAAEILKERYGGTTQ